MAMGPRVLAYSHDGFGLGHLRRNLRLVSGLRRRRPDIDALMVTGASAAERIVSPFGLDWLRLPAVVKVANGRYEVDGEADPGVDVMAYRSNLIADAVRAFRPNLVLVDRYPKGMHDELLPALEELRSLCPDATLVLGLRDILDEASTIREEWRRAGHTEAIRTMYRTVLLYGDPDVFDPVSEYQLPADVAAKLCFTGYLVDDVVAPAAAEVRAECSRPGRRLVVCTLGGGRDAYPLAHCFLSATKVLAAQGWEALLITGPYMTVDDIARLMAHPDAAEVRIVDMVQDVPSHLAAADAVVCMGGYNTMCEVLATSAPAVVVPRVSPRLEQLMRSERFASLGLVSTLHPRLLSPDILARAVLDVSQQAGTVRVRGGTRLAGVAHGGVGVAAALLDALLPVAVSR